MFGLGGKSRLEVKDSQRVTEKAEEQCGNPDENGACISAKEISAVSARIATCDDRSTT